MCFYVDPKFPKPIKLDSHTLCWKELLPERRRWISPYFFTPYVFGQLYKWEHPLEVRAGLNRYYPNRIEHGLHSLSTYADTAYGTAFPALIPAGTPFYYDSVRRELVSTALVVFENMDDLKRYATTFTETPRVLEVVR
jgi:hypothetical protein